MCEKKNNTHSLHKRLEQDGYNIHYYMSGSNQKELIIFLHPAFADHRSFDQQIDFFSKEFSVITVDLLGHGLSQSHKGKDKIDKSSEHLKLIMEKERFEKAHFVGVSMGSLITQYFALLYPDKVSSITILGGYDISADNKELLRAQRSENIKWIFKALFSMNSFRRYISSVTAKKPESKKRIYEMAKMYKLKSFKVMSGLGKVIKKRDYVIKNYPMLILCGESDIDLSKRMAQSFHESEANSVFVFIKGAGHCANMDAEEEFNNILMNFLRSQLQEKKKKKEFN